MANVILYFMSAVYELRCPRCRGFLAQALFYRNNALTRNKIKCFICGRVYVYSKTAGIRQWPERGDTLFYIEDWMPYITYRNKQRTFHK